MAVTQRFSQGLIKMPAKDRVDRGETYKMAIAEDPAAWRKSTLPLAFVLIAAASLEILHKLHDAQWLIWPLAAFLFAVPIVGWKRMGRREMILLSIVAVLSALILLFLPAPLPRLKAGFEQASFMMAFVLFLGQLHEAAARSPSLAELGAMLTRQAKSKRDSLIFIASGAMSVFFSVGVASFLIPIFRLGLARSSLPDTASEEAEFRRQIVAMLRGHGGSILWSPTALAPLTLLMILPGIDRFELFGLGVLFFFLLVPLSLLFTRHRPVTALVPPPPIAPAARRRALWGCAAAALIYMALIAAFAIVFDCEMVLAMMMASPTMLIGWALWQEKGKPQAVGAARIRGILFREIPASAPVAVTMAASGFIGRVAGEFVPARFLTDVLHIHALPDPVLLSLIPPLFCVFSLLSLSPIVLVTFFGGLFAGLDPVPADPTLLAVAICCGCTAAITFSPLAPTVLVSQRVSGIPATVLTLKWNLAYTLGFMALLVPFFWVMAG